MAQKSRFILLSGQLIAVLLIAVGVFYFTPSSEKLEVEAVRASLASSFKTSFNLKILKSTKDPIGPTLVPVVGSEEILLISGDGDIEHSWPFDAVRARLLPNCNLLVIHGTSSFGKDNEPWASLRNVVREYDWNGQIVWEYKSDRVIHHDVHRLPNGNTIFLEREERRLKDKSALNDARGNLIRYDVVKEVSPKGEVVFEWHAIDHLDTSYCGWHGCESRLEENRFRENLHDWMHTNTLSLLPQNHWYDNGDERFRPGNLLIMPRNFWTALIVDRQSGKVVWRYKGSDDNPLIRGHEPMMINKGLPGAGNILLFDNGVAKMRRHSIAREIVPTTKKLAWSYSDPSRFYSKAAGRVQRLKNGNTLISEDRSGRVFEVNSANEILWELQVEGHETSRATRYEPGVCAEYLS